MASREALIVYTIYARPRDWREYYVCRPAAINKGSIVNGPICCVSEDLTTLRRGLDDLGLYQMPRKPGDDPVIVEVWF